MKQYFILSSMILFFGCSHSEHRIPAMSSSDSVKDCPSHFQEIKTQVLDVIKNSDDFSLADQNKKIFEGSRRVQFECGNTGTQKGFRIDQRQQKITIEQGLNGVEALFESSFAKKQVQSLGIELRSLTYDQLESATVLQSLHDLFASVDPEMKYYFLYLNYIQRRP